MTTSKLGLVGLDYKGIAALLAHEGDEEQAAFFSSFAKELRAICKTEYHVSTQMAFIHGKLTVAEREFYSMLAPEPQP